MMADYDTQALAPHSVEAEEAVLGSVLINPGWMVELASIVRPDDFFIVRHRWVWEAMATLHERREPIDYLTVTHELESSYTQLIARQGTEPLLLRLPHHDYNGGGILYAQP